nr:ABC transporter substrate-binding protein [Alphaproteobacteria bacterium]
YKPGELALTIKLPPPSYARRGGEIAAAQLQKAGFKINLIPVEWAQWLDEVFRRKDFDLTIISHTEPLDINIYARPDYYFGYDNAAFKDIINLIAQTTSDEKKIPLYQSAQKMLADDSVNCFLFQLAKHGVWNAQLEGMLENSPIQANDMTEVFWSLK